MLEFSYENDAKWHFLLFRTFKTVFVLSLNCHVLSDSYLLVTFLTVPALALAPGAGQSGKRH